MSSRPAPDATVTLRAAGPEDRESLLRVYASTREEELSVVPWTPEQLAAFVRSQFDAQDAYWSQQRPHAMRAVIELDGRPAGRLYVDRTPVEIRIVDIALLPECRGRGIGGGLLRDLIAEGDAVGLPLTIHVEQGNRARRLYERLGFEPISNAGVYDLYERRVPPQEREDGC